MLPGMYTSLGFTEQLVDDRDQDTELEHDEGEMYEQFKVFYYDVLPEFKKAGKVIQFKVSCNHEPHLRGNVYVQFSQESECTKAMASFNGRWYAGRQLSCEYCPVQKWKTAICGLFNMKKCFKGKHCNFLHVFKNPDREFHDADRDFQTPPHMRHTPSYHHRGSSPPYRRSHRESPRYSRSRERRRSHSKSPHSINKRHPRSRSVSRERSSRRSKTRHSAKKRRSSSISSSDSHSSKTRHKHKAKSKSSHKKKKHKHHHRDKHNERELSKNSHRSDQSNALNKTHADGKQDNELVAMDTESTPHDGAVTVPELAS